MRAVEGTASRQRCLNNKRAAQTPSADDNDRQPRLQEVTDRLMDLTTFKGPNLTIVEAACETDIVRVRWKHLSNTYQQTLINKHLSQPRTHLRKGTRI